MTALRAQALESFLRRPDPEVSLLLVYGGEPDAVRELAARAVKKIAGSLDDPFAVVRLDDQDLAGDPARLVDEVQSMSMLGGSRAIWVKGADQHFLKAAGPILEGRTRGNFVVAEAGVLGKSSALRVAMEKSPHAAIVPLYEAGEDDAAMLLEQLLAQSGLKIEPDARYRFIDLVGSSRGLLQREAEKLAAYAWGQDTVTVADVEAICGNGTEADADDLSDAVFGGDTPAADRIFWKLVAGGSDSGRLVSGVHGHALRLQEFRLTIERGVRAEQVLKSARPPVFFKRQRLIASQLGVWTVPALLSAASSLAGAVLQIRQTASLADSIASRVLLAVARNARVLLAERS